MSSLKVKIQNLFSKKKNAVEALIPSETYEFPRNNRFLVSFPSNLAIEEWWVRKAEIPMVYLYKPLVSSNNLEYGEFEITLQVPIDELGRVRHIFHSLLIEDKATKIDLDYNVLDGTGTSIDKLTIKNCSPTNVKEDDFDVEDCNLHLITITFKCEDMVYYA